MLGIIAMIALAVVAVALGYVEGYASISRPTPQPPETGVRDVMKRLLALLSGDSLVEISKLPLDMQEPLQPFLRRGIRYLTPQEIRRFYDEAGALIDERARLHLHQADLIKAQTNHALAAAMSEFVATLNHEERALLQMRIEAQVRLDVHRLRAENAQLSAEVAHYRNLLPGRR